MNIYIDLFRTFFKIGITTFGGGYAMLPILQREIVENKHWATDEEITDYYAIGQCTPGIIAVNTATFIGSKVKGKRGGLCATLGLILPSLIIILILASVITNFSDSSYVEHAFVGVRIAVSALILYTIMKMFKKSVKDKYAFMIFLGIFTFSMLNSIKPTYLIVISAIVGILFKELEK